MKDPIYNSITRYKTPRINLIKKCIRSIRRKVWSVTEGQKEDLDKLKDTVYSWIEDSIKILILSNL